ncbi:MAG: PIN domain-containing protein [Methanobacteriaceae archaeon]
MIFLDASYLISLIYTKHEKHERAIEIWNQTKKNNNEKIISNLVIAEVITVLDKRIKADNDILKKAYTFLNRDFIIIEDSHLFDNTLQNRRFCGHRKSEIF